MISNGSIGAQRGVALIVAMVLLLVMTMVAVIAMRSTTLDLKMTTNTMQTRRAFQTSDGTRDSISPLLAAHVLNRGWPSEIGGTSSEYARFNIPDKIKIFEPEHQYTLRQNGSFSELRMRRPDIQFEDDVANNEKIDAEDMYSDIWVTRFGKSPVPGDNQGSNAADLGAGSGAARAYVILDVRAVGRAPGNARSSTGSDYRALIQN